VGRWFGYCPGPRYERASAMSARTTKALVSGNKVTAIWGQCRVVDNQVRKGCNIAVPALGEALDQGQPIFGLPGPGDAYQVGD
jgi:hypothetical protein